MLFRTETDIGFVIGNGLIRPRVKKVQAIEECHLPQTHKELKSFLDIAGFYNRFIPNFSGRATALTDMVGLKCLNWPQWTEEAVA